MWAVVYCQGMDPKTKATIGNVAAPTLNIAARVLNHLETIGRPLPAHPDTGYPVIWGRGSSSEHATGRALDFMVTADPDIGDLIAEYLWDRRTEFGLIHVIWRQHIRSTQVDPGVNRKMGDRGSVTENHMDHPHAYFDGRAVSAPTSGKDNGTTIPKPPRKPNGAPKFPLRKGWYFGPRNGPASSVSGYHGNSGHLKRWQKRMAARGWNIVADGLYGPATARVARAFQSEKGLAVDGLIDASTWAAAWKEPVT